jgi:hypothetical protein
MTATYENIATTTLSTDQTDVEFTSISQNFTDLILVREGAQTAGNNSVIQVGNGSYDTGSNYSGTQLFGNGTSALSDRFSNDTRWFVNFANGTNRTMSIYQFMNYSNTTTNKTMIARNSDGSFYASAYVFLWRSTSAINRIKISQGSNGLKSGTTFTLYGIKAE